MRKILFVLSLCLFSSTAFCTERLIGDVASGEMKSVGCRGCHGKDGISVQAMHPNLAGQKELYLVWQLKNFRTGKRSSHIMEHIAAELSDQDIADLSAYYAGLGTR